MLFKLIGGIHEQSGKRYKAGDIVPSSFDLASMFKGKFERVYEQAKPEAAATTTPPLSEGTGKNGGTTSSPPSPNGGEGTGTEAGASTEGGEGGTGNPAPSEHGDDVTEQFPVAVKAGLKVYAKGGWYTVVDPEGVDTVLNEKKLRQDAVADFLKPYVEA